MEKTYSVSDKLCLGFDQTLRALFNNPKTTGRAYPGENKKEAALSQAARKHAAALMRINHAGEICAQALYHGQALASGNSRLKAELRQAAREEGDHLAWCSRRLVELGSHTSYLNPFWYGGSFMLGLLAGLAGERWSLGFVAETEKQVVEHLKGHLQELPLEDEKSIKIVEQMQEDEDKHRQEAEQQGALTLPWIFQKGMNWVSRVMVKTAYWL